MPDNPKDTVSATRASLLGQIRCQPDDQQAWNEFVDRYGPEVYGWCRRRGASSEDAQDVTQEVLVKMASALRNFNYNPAQSFRGWLHTVTRNALHDYFNARSRRADKAAGGSVVLSALHDVEARDDLLERLRKAFDVELVEEAMSRVRLRVTPERWQAFQLTTVDGVSGADVAARLDMPVATVYTAKSQVQRMVRDEIAYLEKEE